MPRADLIDSLLEACRRREVAEAHRRLCALLLMYRHLPGRGAVYLRPTAYRVPVQRLLRDIAGLTGEDKRVLMQKLMKAVGEAVAELRGRWAGPPRPRTSAEPSSGASWRSSEGWRNALTSRLPPHDPEAAKAARSWARDVLASTRPSAARRLRGRGGAGAPTAKGPGAPSRQRQRLGVA
ncbi:MAG: hypothetical protein AT707_02970 [Pyrobaculum sp. JCHS_4]|jgi:hypothetical protein|nr:MAG: hypothetical protein AT707_02970 [Pyrobaculum sp. JCHS_4]